MKVPYPKAILVGLLLPALLLFHPAGTWAKKLYSYQSGNWNGINIWTTDSTGTTLVGSSVPVSNDIVCILTGRTITAAANITTTGHVVYITVGSTLDLRTYSMTSIVLNGSGLLRTSRSGSSVLPTISGGTFLTVEGGTVEYYASSGNIALDASSTQSYCNLRISLGNTSQVVTVTRNLIIYGSFTLNSGTFQINDATTTKRTITVNGNFTVQASGSVTTGTGNTNTSGYQIQPSTNLPPGGQFHTIFHELTIGGHFTNDGTVRFTNLTFPNYGEFASNGAVTVRFNGERHATLTLNGTTDFYNLILDKGIDQTYILTVNPSNRDNFALYGPNAVRRNESSPFTQDDPEVRKALWIKNGTLRLTGYTWIPSLAEGPIGPSGNSDYAIGSKGQLWIDGPNVEVYVTASNANGYPQAPAGASGVTNLPAAEQALSIFGAFRVSDGYFSTRHSAGIIFWNTANSSSVVMVEGGILNTSVMRSTWTAPGKTSYVQTGGTVYVRGNETEPGEMSDVPIFNIPNPSSTFVMTGGDIIIRDRNNGSDTTGGGLFLNCDPGNFSVTGGNITFEVNPVNTPSVDIYSKVNMWNLNVKRLGSTGNATLNMLYHLDIANKLTIFNGATLSSGLENNNIYSYGDIFIEPGGTYDPRLNTTAYNGFGNYFLWNDGAITNGLYNLEVNKTEGSLILVSSANSFLVRNDLRINSGTLADGGKTVFVNGNVVNNGQCIGAGKVSLTRSTGPQTISGNGQGIFQNLEIFNTYGATGSAPVSLGSDITVTGKVTLANDRLFSLNKYQLLLKPIAIIEGSMSSNRFLQTAGRPSDGGLRREYTDTTSFVFPVGTGSNYTPATIHISRIPTTYGSVAVKPVPTRHPFTSNTTCLAYYWKVEESDFTGIRSGSIDLLFNYGNLTDNAAYVPGKYNPAAWVYINDVNLVNESTNQVIFPSESAFTGDYTAGIPSAFGTVTSYYSRTSGAWSSPSTWSHTGHGGAAATTIPGTANPVFIGDGSTYNHYVTVTTGNAVAGSLSIRSGSTLDVGSTSNNNFGAVIPESDGTLRITSNTATALFPAGDFGNFLGRNGGLVEYYSIGTSFFLPVVSSAPTSLALTTYHDLGLAPVSGYTITMPNIDLTVYGYMQVVSAISSGVARLNAASTKTLTVTDSLRIVGGSLVFQNNTPQYIRIEGDLIVGSSASFSVASSGTAAANSISIGGNIVNDGTLDLSISSSLRCDVTFTGNSDALIRGRGSTNDYYSITVNKGISAIPVLNVASVAFTFSNNTAPLDLVNGTFRLTSVLTVKVSDQQFDIPPTTALSANGGTIQVVQAANDDADIILAGLLEVKDGAIIVGNIANNINNDIEYSGAGYPSIEVRGGSLFVNGQIRRSMINGLGSLVYRQSGSSIVTVNGRNGQPTRAKLEVVNEGSIFNMSAGTITIVRGGSTTYNDFYIRPESSSVTGGTVIFGNSSTESSGVNNLTLDSTFPLNNITIDGTTNAKTLTLAVNPLILKGNLVINGSSSFRADSLTVSIAGSLTNLNPDAGTGINTGGYRPGSFRQVTIFNGAAGNQYLTGTGTNITNFANLVITNSYPGGQVSLQTNTDVRVNSDLTLSYGILYDGGNIMTVVGDIYNSATHASESSSSGRLLLAGANVQTISGNGSGKFGNLYLNASYDVRMIENTEITGVLTFQGKLLDIGHKLLVLSNTSSGAVAGTFSTTCNIRSDGLVSDAGVRKHFPSGSQTFTFPVGVPGKYERAVMTINSNSAPGTITVIPVNSVHPCVTGSVRDTLRFYWHVLSTGFSNVNITHQYYYTNADVGGTESNYVGNRYYNGLWDNPYSGTMSTSLNRITFSNKSFIDGDYTAGRSSLFGTVLVYYSRNATCTNPSVGLWEVNSTWSTDTILQHAGVAATSFPTGEPVVIANNHIVSTSTNSRKSSSTTLNGTALLNLASTFGHDLGTVTGTGTIRLNPTTTNFFIFPGGNYTTFSAAGGGTVELVNSSGSAMFPYPLEYNNLSLIGGGEKDMIDADITINGTLRNESGSVFSASPVGNLILKSDWLNDGTFTHNGGTVVFGGVTNLTGNSMPVLNNLAISSAAELTPASSATLGVAGNWVNNGIFNHNSGTVSFTGSSTVSGLSVTTFNNLMIQSGDDLTGMADGDMILDGNWTNNGTFHHNGSNVVFEGLSQVSGASRTTFGSVTITPDSYLTGPQDDTMAVAIDFINDGTFLNNGGTLEFSGGIQTLGGASSTQFENIMVDAGSVTTIVTPGQTLGAVLLCHGELNANDNLTMLSDADRTALIDGSGEGEVYGNVTIQRYLPSGFGYKYFSSPFQSLDVSQFGDHMDLYAWFPTFYRYDENRLFTGWLTYTDPANLLNPMEGYAVNFGPVAGPVTVDLIGQVNNNTMLPMTMYNRNRPFTKGFNLIGNPYPSPVDWDDQDGWVRAGIDDALYYFNAGTTDQYTGTYSTYIDGVSSDNIASNIIPAMQGFFIHVEDGTYPVAATLIFTNGVRVNNLSPHFHKSTGQENRPLLRMSARMADIGTGTDPTVIYFQDGASPSFNPKEDALKLMNTDVTVPSFYSLSDDQRSLSISGCPLPADSLTVIPLGVSLRTPGTVVFRCANIERLPDGLFIYFCDRKNGVEQNLLLHPEYRAELEAGETNDRFVLIFSTFDRRYKPPSGQMFHVYASHHRLFIHSNLLAPETAATVVYNMMGQPVLEQLLTGTGYTEIDTDLATGIYVVTVRCATEVYTRKVYLHRQW